MIKPPRLPTTERERIVFKLDAYRQHYDNLSRKGEKGESDYWIAKRIAYGELSYALDKIVKEVEDA